MLIAYLILLCPFTKETILVLLLKWTGEMHISADASALCLLKSRGVVTVSVRASLCSLIWCKGQSNLLMRALSQIFFFNTDILFFNFLFFPYLQSICLSFSTCLSAAGKIFLFSFCPAHHFLPFHHPQVFYCVHTTYGMLFSALASVYHEKQGPL